MDNLALELVNYVKDDRDQNQEIKELYKSLMYALEDMEYLAKLPEKYQDQKVVEDAWSICEERRNTFINIDTCLDMLPNYLIDAGVTPYEIKEDINSRIEERIEDVISFFDAERVSSDAIEEAFECLTLENAEEICRAYIEYMEEEYDQDLEVYNNHGDPYIVKYGKITERAVLDYDKIVEIANTSGSDYFNIEFDWGV